jgi:hypothetical protein
MAGSSSMHRIRGRTEQSFAVVMVVLHWCDINDRNVVDVELTHAMRADRREGPKQAASAEVAVRWESRASSEA